MEEKLKYIFTNVNDWLKFAEAKNGVLIAFNGAAIFGLLQSKSSITNDHLSSYLFCICVPILIMGIGISLFSFLPVLKLFFKEIDCSDEAKAKRVEHSVFYFEHVKQFGYEEYLEKLYKAGGLQVPSPLPPIEADLSHQIITNAGIAWRKNIAFRIAAGLTLILLLIPIPFLIYYLFQEFKKQ